MTYDELAGAGQSIHYRWIQVDEVQDLNPLQLAIVDQITAHESLSEKLPSTLPLSVGATVMYLGDEQQAIFSFMGAKLSTINTLKDRCRGHIHFLSINHRSPQYLLNVFNEYARNELGISPALLPKAATHASAHRQKKAEAADLRILRSNTIETEYYDVAHLAQNLCHSNPGETTAIIVNSKIGRAHV